MKLSSLGIDHDGRHTRAPLTGAEAAFLGILWIDHVGAERKIAAKSLAREYARTQGEYIGEAGGYEKLLQTWMREVRHMQNHLVMDHNVPILSQAGVHGGYWIAENEYEAAAFYATFRQRGMTGLTKAARGNQAVLVEMVGQLSFQFDRLADVTGQPIETIAGRATPIEVVDALIAKMMREPEKFKGDLIRLNKKLSSVLMPKVRMRQIARLTSQLGELVAGWN